MVGWAGGSDGCCPRRGDKRAPVRRLPSIASVSITSPAGSRPSAAHLRARPPPTRRPAPPLTRPRCSRQTTSESHPHTSAANELICDSVSWTADTCVGSSLRGAWLLSAPPHTRSPVRPSPVRLGRPSSRLARRTEGRNGPQSLEGRYVKPSKAADAHRSRGRLARAW